MLQTSKHYQGRMWKTLTRKMKDSGIEWIGEIPENWEVVQVKHLFEIGRGRVISKEELKFDSQTGYPVYSSQTKNDGVLGFIGTYDFDQPQLTWTTDGANAGTVFLRKGKYNCTNVCGTLKLKSDIQDKISLDYVYHALYVGAPYYKRKDTNGYKIMNNEMAVIKISLPPLDMQEKVSKEIKGKVKIIHDLIVKTNQSIEELKKYKQSLITEAVTKGLDPNVEMKDSGIEWIGKIPKHWSMSRIKNKFTLNKGLTITKSDLKDKGIPVINYGEIHSKYGFRFDTKIHPVKNVDEEYLTKNENSLIKKGDFIFADTSEDLDGSGNFTCYIGDTQCFAGSHTVILKPRKNINHLYFSYLFESLAFRAQIQEKVQGIKVFSITQGILKPLTLIIPTEQEQEQIVSYLDEQTSRIDKLIADKTKVIDELEDYKKSLIYEYVTGKKEV